MRQGLASTPERRVHMEDPAARSLLVDAIRDQLALLPEPVFPLTAVCIGSDRSTGDSLGPLVGTSLERLDLSGLEVKGTLERPVHAANLAECLHDLHSGNRRRTIVAIDACLGRSENVGTVCVKAGPLRPGTGVNKALPAVGHFHMVGVVNVGGFMEYFVLQNTRLNLVMRLAELIAQSLAECAARSGSVRTAQMSPVAASVEE